MASLAPKGLEPKPDRYRQKSLRMGDIDEIAEQTAVRWAGVATAPSWWRSIQMTYRCGFLCGFRADVVGHRPNRRGPVADQRRGKGVGFPGDIVVRHAAPAIALAVPLWIERGRASWAIQKLKAAASIA